MLHVLVQQSLRKYRRLKAAEIVYKYTRGANVQLQFCCNVPMKLLTHYITITRGSKNFPKIQEPVNILGAKTVTWSKLITRDSQIKGSTLQNSIGRRAWRPHCVKLSIFNLVSNHDIFNKLMFVYVCMYVCMYELRMHNVCMIYACMYVCIYVWMYVCILYVWCMCVCMYVCMYVCVSVCMYLSLSQFKYLLYELLMIPQYSGFHSGVY
jgi:hypothetical protein